MVTATSRISRYCMVPKPAVPLRRCARPMAPDARPCQGRIMAQAVQMRSERDPIHVRFTLPGQMVIDESTNGGLIGGAPPKRAGCGARDTGAIGKTEAPSRPLWGS